ncbi:MAG: tryptophan 7-halogenase [Phycisphaerae bacterium]|jgi:flavin-dependent dehydrogenase
MSVPQEYEVIVIGGGPSGSTAAALLAGMGRRVVLIEKEKFPRYHIGESLLPYSYFILQRLGLIERMKASHFPKKYSVKFVSTNGKVSQPFYFFEHLKHEAAQTWQVVRGEFDHMLLENAREKGARVLEETLVREAVLDNDRVVGVKAAGRNGETYEFRAPMTIDASGRDAFSIVRRDWRVRDPYLNKMALWTYYRGAVREPGIDEGGITVAYLPEKGWFWYIPLPDDVISVGIVGEMAYLYREGRDLEKIFDREVENNLWIKEHLAPGRRIEAFRATSEYSYRSKHCSADGLLLVGDAFAFLDPVFSSGVFLALRSGEMAADAVDRALTIGDTSAGQFDAYGRELCRGIEAMRNLVYAFYDQAFSFGDLLRKYPHLKGDTTDCLIGNLFRDFDPLFTAVGEFAKLPPPLPYGRAAVRGA